MVKVFIILLAIAVAMWGTGINLASIKSGLTGTASEGAQSLTGHEDDWG